MKMASVNNEHAELLNDYVTYIQGIVYEATEDSPAKKFEEFNEILANIINYTNAFQKIVKSSKDDREWVYMQPNLMLYASMGFLSGIKNRVNRKLINSLTERLFDKTVDFVGETTDILDEISRRKERAKNIKIIQKHRDK
jgi:hypothetical protein